MGSHTLPQLNIVAKCALSVMVFSGKPDDVPDSVHHGPYCNKISIGSVFLIYVTYHRLKYCFHITAFT